MAKDTMVKALFLSVALVASLCVKFSHGASCACEAENTGFAINCDDQNATIDALASLDSNNCVADCSSDVCRRSYFIIQTHHDYCFEDQVAPIVETGVHDYESACEDCDISRRPNPNFPMCPSINCKVDGPGNDAYQALLDGGCLADCSSADCVDNYRILVAAHDTCPEDSLTQDAEEGLHDLEPFCENQGCNIVADDSQLVCLDSASSGALFAPLLPSLTAGAAAALMMAHAVLF